MRGYKGSVAEPARTDVPAVLKAPLFNMLAAHLRRGDRSVVLDLGAPRASTIAFCNQFPCRLDIASLIPHLDFLNGEEDVTVLAERAEAMLPARREEAVDAVLCWDILNYLKRSAITALMSRVAARARNGTLVHVLIVYSAPRMPARPGAYSPVMGSGAEESSDIRLLNMPTTGEERDAPGYTPEALGRCLSGYHMERGMLLSNGMQEFLYRL